MIAIDHFSLFLNGKRLLKDINFTIFKHDWLTIIGPNGSGKTTMLKSLLRLLEGATSTGSILLNNTPLEKIGRMQLATQIAYCPQRLDPVPPMLAEDFIKLSGYARGYRASLREKKLWPEALEALELMEVKNLADRNMRTLSGGQLQRVSLAAAIAQQAPILLLDEPDSFLDPPTALQMFNILKKLNSHCGLTIIMVTHNLSLPFATDGKALCLKDGRQIFFGDSQALLAGNDILETVFNCKFHYLKHPVTGRTIITV